MEPLPKERSDDQPVRARLDDQRASMEPLPKERSDGEVAAQEILYLH